MSTLAGQRHGYHDIHPATNVGGQLITGWVYGDETAIPGYTGQPIWANRFQIYDTSPTAITFDLYLGIWSVGRVARPVLFSN